MKHCSIPELSNKTYLLPKCDLQPQWLMFLISASGGWGRRTTLSLRSDSGCKKKNQNKKCETGPGVHITSEFVGLKPSEAGIKNLHSRIFRSIAKHRSVSQTPREEAGRFQLPKKDQLQWFYAHRLYPSTGQHTDLYVLCTDTWKSSPLWQVFNS